MPAPVHPRAGRPAPGPADAEARLKRILDLEERLGFTDRAVMGGLDGYLTGPASGLSWLRTVPPMRGQTYASLSQKERRHWAGTVMARLGSGGPRRGGADTSPRPAPVRRRAALDSPLSQLKLFERTPHAKLARLGISNLRDLLWHFPVRHIDYSSALKIHQLEEGTEASVIGRVRSVERVPIGGPPGAAKAVISDGTGLLTATWFRQSYLVGKLVPGTNIAVSGRAYGFQGSAQMDNPEYEVIPAGGIKEFTHAGNLLPVYPLTEGLPQRTLRTAARRALDLALGRPPYAGPCLLPERLPAAIARRHGFPGLATAVEDMHFPHSPGDRDAARRRLAFDELFCSQVAVLQRKAAWRTRGGAVRVPGGDGAVAGFLEGLAYKLTEDQRGALATILGELAGDVPMGRLLQGEVGSGKTVVALAALLAASAAGYQGALMAPTEVLAEQHFIGTVRQLGAATPSGMPEVVAEFLSPGRPGSPVRLALLIGSLSPRTKAAVQRLIASGDVNIVIGTHALLQEGIAFPRLALAVIDEQHRFGVDQRAALTARQPRPHMLALSATPIPRSLSLTVYGDLELSTLRQLPAGRRPIHTSWARSLEDRSKAYELVRTQVAAGRQAFIVCPLIEPSEEVRARAAVTECERLRNGELAGLRLGLLHGRMSLSEKQLVMDQMRSGAVQVLVATPVIEVGVDIPNAAVMLIESADRFGLAQLHQFRGRVGRSVHASYCVLLSDDPGEDARARLSVIARVADGFELAEEDLRLRGPGDYIGTRQSGWADLKVARFSDVELLTLARREAADTLAADPLLARQDHALLAAEVTRVSRGRMTDAS